MSLELNNKIKINTYKNAFFQAVTILLGFYMYPLLLGYLDDISLGVWFTIISITSWIMILDIGISNGLRNKLSELIVKNQLKLSRVYLSSTYYYFGLFIVCIVFILGLVLKNIDGSFIFNIAPNSINDLNLAIFLVIATVLINLLFNINFSLSNALHNASFVNFRNMLFSLQMILLLLIFMTLKKGTVLDMALIFSISNMSVNIITTYILYKKNKVFIPSFKLVSFKFFSTNLKLGLNFFIINIASLILFATDNILIAHLLGVEYVTQYTITLKVFMIFVMIQSFYTGPLWSAYAEKFNKKDFSWIRQTLKKSLYITAFIYLVMVVTINVFPLILSLWLNDQSYYNGSLVIAIAIYISVRLWSSNFSTLFNGLSMTLFQKYTSIFATVVNIPLSIYLVNYSGLGIAGIAYGSAISLGLFAIIAPFITHNLFKKELNK